ncbi:MAG: glycosyltransferase family 2 protein [Pseudomonadota bacterium]
MTRTTHIEVSILVVSFNTRALTLAALDSVLAETRGIDVEVIVVDNASSDGSAEAIASHPLGVRLIALADNLGFARANNLAAKTAKGRYLLLLNPDTVVLDRAITRLVAFADAEPQARIWGGRTLFPDGSLNPASCWRRMTLWNLVCRASGLTGLRPRSELFNGEAYGDWPRDSVRRVDIVSGCFLLIERALWERLDGFDPAFFMYGEEADLCLRAEALGARPLVTPDATIIHLGGASERARADKMVRLLAAKAALIARHFPPARRSAGLALLALWPLTRWIALAAAARLTGSTSRHESAAVWRTIWRRRTEWASGYPLDRPRSFETPASMLTSERPAA